MKQLIMFLLCSDYIFASIMGAYSPVVSNSSLVNLLFLIVNMYTSGCHSENNAGGSDQIIYNIYLLHFTLVHTSSE